MTENLKNFMEKVSGDAKLSEEIIRINNEFPEIETNKNKVIEFAKSIGMKLTDEDFDISQPSDEQKTDELSEDELQAVTGGAISIENRGKYEAFFTTDCHCVLGGGGSENKYQKTCVCIAAGFGELTGAGKRLVKDAFNMQGEGSSSAPVALWCAGAGIGVSGRIEI